MTRSLALSSLACVFVFATACSNVVSQTGPFSRASTSSSSKGAQALTNANNAADDCQNAIDDVDQALSNGTNDQNGIDDANAALDAATQALEQAASAGACTCDTASLQSQIDAGDTALQPILDGCNAANADALAASQNASPGVCEAIAHEIASMSDQLSNAQQQAGAVDAANAACTQAFADADAQVAALQQQFQQGCAADPSTCDACAFSTSVTQLYATAQATCDASLQQAGVDVTSDPNGGNQGGADPCAPGANDPNAGGQNGQNGQPGSSDPNDPNANDPNAGNPNAGNPNAGDPNADACTQAYEDAQNQIQQAATTLQQTCMQSPDDCDAATDAYNTAVEDALNAADAACGFGP